MPSSALSRSLHSKSKKKEELFKFPRMGCPYPLSASGRDAGGWLLTEEMFQRVPWVELFSTGPEDP